MCIGREKRHTKCNHPAPDSFSIKIQCPLTRGTGTPCVRDKCELVIGDETSPPLCEFCFREAERRIMHEREDEEAEILEQMQSAKEMLRLLDLRRRDLGKNPLRYCAELLWEAVEMLEQRNRYFAWKLEQLREEQDEEGEEDEGDEEDMDEREDEEAEIFEQEQEILELEQEILEQVESAKEELKRVGPGKMALKYCAELLWEAVEMQEKRNRYFARYLKRQEKKNRYFAREKQHLKDLKDLENSEDEETSSSSSSQTWEGF